MSVVLYRKYRPQNFSEIIGQDHVVQTLTNSVSAKNISHAYLFSGPRGSGKTSVARLFAKAINCVNASSFEPCNKCDSCLEITQGKAMDLVEIDAASHTGVDDVRELIEGIKFSPIKLKYKVFIIDECHQLSKAAANALLKTLEEPPAHAVFLLATTESHKMIPTIISRCQRFDFRRLQIPEIIKKLEFISQKEGLKFEARALSLIALNSKGSYRDAESLMDQCISFSGSNGLIKAEDVKSLLGIVEVSQIAQFVDFIASKDAKSALAYVNSVAESGIDMQEFAKTLVFYLRQAMLLKINPMFLNSQNSGLSLQEIEKIKLQTANFSSRDIHSLVELFIDAENKIKYSALPQLPLELAIINIVHQG